jgi:hypothetical protein
MKESETKDNGFVNSQRKYDSKHLSQLAKNLIPKHIAVRIPKSASDIIQKL